MGAYVLVFHIGFHGRFEKEFAFKTCLNAIKEVSAEMHNLGLRVKLGPETMGRKFQVGSLDEILTINEQIEATQLVIDWGHLHAIGLGAFKKSEDFRAVAEKIEQKLGTKALRTMHCHFSAIEFNSLGEKEHHSLDEKRYGPDFRLLAEVIADFQMHPTMICETPNLDVDARKMQAILKDVLESKAQRAQP
jgi:deoxyribonuclease-4